MKSSYGRVLHLLAAAVPILAQCQNRAAAQAVAPPPALISPEVLSDNRVTFRLRDPDAKQVSLERDGAKPLALEKGDEGVWSVTTDALEPDFYGYSFVADGVHLIDPSNSLVKPNLINMESQVHVPGPDSLPWEINRVPHGEIHHHFYHSEVVGDDRDFYVYTPPGYDRRAKKAYPVLYLLHGFSDDARAWTDVGRANVIVDNLIARGTVQPMILVMPLGYGAPEIVSGSWRRFEDLELRQRNFAKFEQALLGEVVPQVETGYRVKTNRSSRAIAGLSMGGAEALLTGLNNPDKFSWIASFSGGGLTPDFGAQFPALNTASGRKPSLLWIACGQDDRLIEINRSLRAWLKSKGLEPVEVETPGAHAWMVWRRNLAALAPLLFR
jgi:enterochelin esterase family protein